MRTERRPHEDEGRDQNDVSTSQGTPKMAGNHRKLRKRPGTDAPSWTSEGITLLIPWPWTTSPRNCERTHFCCLSHSICGTVSAAPGHSCTIPWLLTQQRYSWQESRFWTQTCRITSDHLLPLWTWANSKQHCVPVTYRYSRKNDSIASEGYCAG